MKKYIIGGASCFIVLGWIILYLLTGNQTFLYAGTLETDKTIVASKVNNDIIFLPFLEGDWVKTGDVIARINDDVYQIAAQKYDADYRRYSELYKCDAVTKAELDTIEFAKKDNDLKIDWCVIRSPLSGIITISYRELGEFVSAGSPIVSISDPYKIWAYFYVPYDKVHELHVGDKVTGILQELPKQTFSGVIVKINEEAEFTPKNVQTRQERTRLIYGVKVEFENPNLLLKSGMTMETAFER